MKTIYDSDFDSLNNNKVFQILPNVYADSRGYFTEVLKIHEYWPKDDMPLWFANLLWVRQVNRSSSKAGTVRGCHALSGVNCQAKLVEALNTKIYDIITDARPDSKTFGLTKVYVLDPIILNKLFVPKGFLHSFAVPFGSDEALFQYFCDGIFDKHSEIGINPMSILPIVVKQMKETNPNSKEYSELYELFENEDKLLLSEKDCKAKDYNDWMTMIKKKYDKTHVLWYK